MEYRRNSRIALRVVGQDGRSLLRAVNRNDPLCRLLRFYCLKFELEFEELNFTFDGVPVYEHDTPNMLVMENMDTIQAFKENT